MNGVTGRMGTNQHLLRSIMTIIEQGGVRIDSNTYIVPDPILVGRDPAKLEVLVKRTGIQRVATNLEEALSDPSNAIYFDAQTTQRRMESVRKAIEAGKHIYCEKPTALTSVDAMRLYVAAGNAGVLHGVVQDKLWLPGILKLKTLCDQGFFGRILSVRGEFGYWGFEGDTIPTQRPAWNYRAEDGGGIIFDMFCHWRYLLDHLFGGVRAVCALGATHIPKRWDENGQPYECTAEDAAYAFFKLGNGAIGQFNSSWCVRVRRDDLLTLQVDGTGGSAVATLRKCFIQPQAATPKPVWNPDVNQPIDFFDNWMEVPDTRMYDNAFKIQWELFLKAVGSGSRSFQWDLLAGAKGVHFAERGMESWKKESWVDVEPVPPMESQANAR